MMNEAKFKAEAVRSAAGEWTWKSNGHAPFDEALAAAGICEADRKATAALRERQVAEFCAEYRTRKLSPEDEAEHAFERRAAFGPGVAVVDVITGRRFRT